VDAIRQEDGQPIVTLEIITVNQHGAIVFTGTAEAVIDP
jgi:hypothetical protein